MNRPLATGDAAHQLRSVRFSPALTGLVFLLVSSALSYFIVSRFSVPLLVLGLGGLIAFTALLYISMRDISTAVVFWLISMVFYRGLLLVRMPTLPDFSMDRLMLVWIMAIFAFNLILRRQRIRGPYLADWLILIHTVYVLVQSQIVGSVHFHAWVVSNLSPFFAYLVGKHATTDQKGIRNIVIFFLAVSIYYYVQSIAQYLGLNFLVWPRQILDPNVPGLWQAGRSRGPILHPPLFGQLMAMFLLVHFYLLVRPGRPFLRFLLMVSLALALLGEFFAYTRGPWVAVAAGIGVLGVLRPGYRRILVGLAVLGLIMGTLGITRLANSDFLQSRLQNTDTVENRFGFLANALRMIQDYPVFGVGFFKYTEKMKLYNQGSEIPFYGFVKKRMGKETTIHDIYLGRTAEEGLFGTFLLLGFTLLIVRAFLRKWRANPQEKWFNRDLLALFAGIMVCYMVGGMVIDFRYFDMVNVCFFLLAGIINGYGNERYGNA